MDSKCHVVKDRTAAAKDVLEDYLLPCARILSVETTLALTIGQAMKGLESLQERRHIINQAMSKPLNSLSEWKALRLLVTHHFKYTLANKEWYRTNADWLAVRGKEPSVAALVQARDAEMRTHEAALA